uniref:Putative secreted protein n=1 Tax=Ixodes ricinus TaxID=34613 RepID=A0A6B0U0N3_IXORI
MLKSYFHYVPLALSQVLILPTACTTLCFALRWTTVDSNCCPSQSSTANTSRDPTLCMSLRSSRRSRDAHPALEWPYG